MELKTNSASSQEIKSWLVGVPMYLGPIDARYERITIPGRAEQFVKIYSTHEPVVEETSVYRHIMEEGCVAFFNYQAMTGSICAATPVRPRSSFQRIRRRLGL